MSFEFDGKQYAQASTHQKEWGARLVAELALRGDEHILDLGCGDGALTAQLAESVPHGRVVGIDSSRGMIETARERQGANLQFEFLDINQLDFREQFDVVFSNATLHWIKNHRNLLARVFRSLKDNGVGRFNFAADGNCSNFNRIVREVMSQAQYAGCFRSFDWPWYMPKVEDYRLLASQLPFRELNVWGENADRHFPDSEAMIRWIDQPSLVPFLVHVGAQKERFRCQVIERMIKATKQADGRCFETFRRINLFARK
jgi:trans-aconitate 2-methyltransferase